MLRGRDALLPGSVLLAGISAAMFAGLAAVGVHLVSQTTRQPAAVSVRNVSGEVAVPEAAPARHHLTQVSPSPVSVSPVRPVVDAGHRHGKPVAANGHRSAATKHATAVTHRPSPSPTPTPSPTSGPAHGKGHAHANGRKH